jgi:NodT family efflux transporter outer membrane factor (OMF) lipoprotein
MAASYAAELGGGAVAGPAELGRWWARLGDPTLDSLVERAVAGNLTLREARARVVEARAQRRVVGADRYPTVDAAGSYTRSRGSENVLLGGSGFGAGGVGAPVVALPGAERDLYQAGFDASWEIDVFGGTRRAVEAADADTEAAVAGLHDAMVTLLAEVARNYVEVRSLQERVRIAQENARAQAETAGLSRAKSEAGLTSELDPVRAEAQLAATRAQIPALEAQLRQAEHRLAVLLGARPGSLGAELEAAAPVPPIPERVAVGIPSDLLRRRPDIRRAERELAAATARIGVATADLFPRFSLTGSFGLQSTKVASLADGDSRFWAIGPAVRWPVLSGGRIRGNIQVQGALEEQALARYEGAVLTALEDVENALVNYSREQARRDSLAQGVASARTALGLATELNARGLTDFLSVLDAQRQLFALEDQLAQSEGVVTANVIALYKALGGGWEGAE